MFHFTFREVRELPRLAWCAKLSRGQEEIVVEHGAWVETKPSFFAEGAWNGDFDAGDFDSASVLLGSGGCLSEEETIFCTTSHTMERLQGVHVGDTFFISNSFAYLLAATGDAVDVNYRYYERDFMAFLKGRRKATRVVPTVLKRQVKLFYGEKVCVGSELNVRLDDFPQVPSFASYEEYVATVYSLLTKLHDNANALSRKVRYDPISTISRGYDSPACTVLAKKIGCNEAITILEARSVENADCNVTSDSGTEIAKHLKVDVNEFHRDAYRGREDFPEAEFIATGNGGEDVVMGSAASLLPGKMFFTGFLGDTLWGLNAAHPDSSRDYVYTFPAGGTLGEFRLRVGFIHVPIPLLTFTRRPEVNRISHSEEMAAWRIGGAYDRPIPRRLVETNGVPRGIYAQEKTAVTQPFGMVASSERLRKMMSAKSYDSLVSYAQSVAVSSRLSLRSKIKLATSPFMVFIARRLNLYDVNVERRIDWYTVKIERLIGIRLMPRLVDEQFRSSVLFSTLVGLKFHWAIDKVSERYKITNHQCP